jgi:hypothetical protein
VVLDCGRVVVEVDCGAVVVVTEGAPPLPVPPPEPTPPVPSGFPVPVLPLVAEVELVGDVVGDVVVTGGLRLTECENWRNSDEAGQ